MLRKKAESVTTLLAAFLRENGLETPLNEYRAQQAWSTVVGEAVNRYTRSVEVRGGVMYVALANASLRANMMMTRTHLVQRINAAVGAQVINTIVFR